MGGAPNPPIHTSKGKYVDAPRRTRRHTRSALWQPPPPPPTHQCKIGVFSNPHNGPTTTLPSVPTTLLSAVCFPPAREAFGIVQITVRQLQFLGGGAAFQDPYAPFNHWKPAMRGCSGPAGPAHAPPAPLCRIYRGSSDIPMGWWHPAGRPGPSLCDTPQPPTPPEF